jgi:DNA-binding NtrC family response regulator
MSQKIIAKVLIIDDDQSLCQLLGQILKSAGYQALTASSAGEGLNVISTDQPDLVLLDMRLPDAWGLDLVPRIREVDPDVPLIVITGHASIEDAVKAIKAGVYDYLQKPLHTDSVLIAVAQAVERRKLMEENRYLQKTLNERYGFDNIIAKSRPMMAVFSTIRKIAETKTTVLIMGESGTGKELAARAVHFNSRRKEARFVPINCGGIPETLLESELFGYVKGAFTGANGSKEGLFRTADKGTIFLDEISTMPLSLQVKLLRVLQEGVFYPLGSTVPVEVDVRVIAATNQNLEEAVSTGTFREDLFYRLNVIQIKLPPLRERRDDILLLAHHFLKKYTNEQGKTIEGFSNEVIDFLLRSDWPGNVRELENAVEHGVALCTEKQIGLHDFPQRRSNTRSEEMPLMIDCPLHQARDEFEKRYIIALLKLTGGNVTKASEMAGIARQNMQLKLKEYGINSKSFSHKTRERL